MVLGTNPISLGAPANDGDNFVLDMATTATALGKVNIYYTPHHSRATLLFTLQQIYFIVSHLSKFYFNQVELKGKLGQTLPGGWAIDHEGKVG